MHLPDGVLEARHAGAWYLVVVLFILKGLAEVAKKSRQIEGFKALLGLLGAVIFVVSLLPIPVPVAGTSSHPVGTPLAGIMVGPYIGTLLGSVALFLHAAIFLHGGFSTLGANIFSMGVIGSTTAFLLFHGMRWFRFNLLGAAGAAAFVGSLAVYAATTAQLAVEAEGAFLTTWASFMALITPVQAPLALFEAVITAFMVNYIFVHRPEILAALGVIRAGEVIKKPAGEEV